MIKTLDFLCRFCTFAPLKNECSFTKIYRGIEQLVAR